MKYRACRFFRRRAYETAAANIEHTTTALFDLWKQDELDAVAGLGEKFEEYIDELFTTGKIAHFEHVLQDFPAGFAALLPLEWIGAKRAFTLAQEFQLTNPKTARDDLRKLAEAGEIRKLDRFGEGSEQKIIEALDRFAEQANQPKRMLLSEAEALVDEIMQYLRQSDAVLEAEALGSFRRHAPTIGDIDIAVKSEEPHAVMEHVRAFPGMQKILSTGDTTTMFKHTSGRQVDVKTEPPASWGSLLQHYTGSKAHNIALRVRAKQQGLSISEHGIKDPAGVVHPKATEAEVYGALGLEFIPPELREGRQELELAAKQAVPELVELSDIQGDFHVHTDLDVATSHDIGSTPTLRLLERASEKNYRYIGFSDHNPKLKDLTTADKKKILSKRRDTLLQAYETFEKQASRREGVSVPKMYIGLEIDIRPDGSLALEDELLDMLDYAIISVHSQFHQDIETATQRILSALEHPKVKIWGHPTGRMIQERSGLEYDWDTLLPVLKQKDMWIEVNASPRRLDVPDDLIPKVVTAGVPLVINTDAHHEKHLDFMKYGVWMARRGGAEAKDVANARALKQLRLR
ncbi:PHP domain-containing protein [Candidatus Woesebacteria bacterium]|nr:PHP domain-containing protein [Candidatus Woesebacteria bacterium]